MPLAVRIAGLLAVASVAACAVAGGSIPDQADFLRLPREIRMGAADMVIEPLRGDAPPQEVESAVGELVAQAPMCFAWPGVWLDGSNRRNIFLVRYDLMRRDWGASTASASAARMREFVDMGYLSERDVEGGAVEYALTPEGDLRLRGSPYGGERPSFCAPSERRLVSIEEATPGQFPCGSLHVRFTHVGDAWPSWARTPGLRARVTAAWGELGEMRQGEVTLSRQWFRRPPPGQANGALRSLCYDATRQRVTGDDLNLSSSP